MTVATRSSKITYAKGEFEKDMADVIELCSTWWEDSKFHNLYRVKYNVDVSFFRQINLMGLLIYTIGRDEDGKIQSCFVGVKSPYMFNPSLLSASEIVWCVRKEKRSFRALISLVEAIEKLMEESAVKSWNLNVSAEEKYESTEQFLKKKGYTLMDKVYSKYKGGEVNG